MKHYRSAEADTVQVVRNLVDQVVGAGAGKGE